MLEITEQVDAWLEPLSEASCGEDLEYDNAFLELSKAAEGKPETQFSEAEPADWRQVREMAEAMFERTRDLRVGMFWGRAQLHQLGLAALPEVLRLTRGLLERYWDEVHPMPDPDDGDPYARLNLLTQWEDPSLALGDVRQSKIIASRSVGLLTVRDLELALERLTPRDDESVLPLSSVQQMLQAAIEENPDLRTVASTALDELNQLLSLLEDRVGYGRAPSCDDLKAILTGLNGLIDEDRGAGDGSFDASSDDFSDDASDAMASFSSRGGAGAGMSGRIETRADAIKAIEMICAYLDEAEPTSPAQLLLRRAQRLIDKSFIDLIRELAPDALGEVAKIMGVDPSESGRDGFDD